MVKESLLQITWSWFKSFLNISQFHRFDFFHASYPSNRPLTDVKYFFPIIYFYKKIFWTENACLPRFVLSVKKCSSLLPSDNLSIRLVDSEQKKKLCNIIKIWNNCDKNSEKITLLYQFMHIIFSTKISKWNFKL